MDIRWPAEWEPQDTVWFVWPRDPLSWPNRLDQARIAIMECMRYVETPHLVVTPELAADCRQQLARLHLDPIIHEVAYEDSWMRDYGPLYVETNDGLVAKKFTFNAWGEKYDDMKDDTHVVGRLGKHIGAPVEEVDVILEGGSIDTDGQGTFLTTTSCLLHENRGGRSKIEMERHLTNHLGARKVIWLEDGIQGDDTDGHVDDIARFVSQGVVAAAVAPEGHPDHDALARNLELLRASHDADGRRLQVVDIPMPEPIQTDDGEPLPATHLNFLVTNKAVLMPTFGGPSDKVAMEHLQACFTRPVVPIDCSDLIWGMGAIHCLTMQRPAISPSRVWLSAQDLL